MLPRLLPPLLLAGADLLGAQGGESPPAPAPGAAVLESDVCANCHSNAGSASAMRDASARAIAPYDLWRGTMMANSARDPLWRAAVAAEVAATPARRAEIEAECLGCHAPMASRVGLVEHGTGSAMHVLDCQERIGELARDGVSCTICHGMAPQGLGTPASYSGHFQLDPERRLFGPHERPFEMPMRMSIGFVPTHSTHVLDSALCGSCHTLFTSAFHADGSAVGTRFLEQAPYLEWRNSDFSTEGPAPGPLRASCQDCHLPVTDADGRSIATRIARNPGGFDFPPTEPRSPFGRHLLVGANVLMLGILAEHAAELGVLAPREAFEASIAATREQLRRRSARVAIEALEREGDRLAFEVEIQNLAGHKLPTAHPTRRVWLRATVLDSEGRTLFASGGTDEAGRIIGADGAPLAFEEAGGPTPLHRSLVRAPDEVALFQAVMADPEGRPTHTLMRGTRWLVDNRILPRGWDAHAADAALTAPVGTGDDPHFRPGSARVRYELELPAGPLSIEVELLHQPLSARWAAEIFRHEAADIERFRRMYEGADRSPELLARAALRT